MAPSLDTLIQETRYAMPLPMKKLSRNERRETIRSLVAERGNLHVEELSERLGVTTMTVRRDLAALEDLGFLVRTYGGCSVLPTMVRQLTSVGRELQQAGEKTAIARAALRYLSAGQAIYIDTGSTCSHLARVLPDHLDLRVFTNNLKVVSELSGRDGCDVIVYGGRLRKGSSHLGGEIALPRMQDFLLDVAFFGADAVEPTRGEVRATSTESPVIFRVLEMQATRQVFLVDSTKFRKRGSVVLAKLHPGMTLITDSGIHEDERMLLQKSAAEIVIVDPPEDGAGP